MSALEPGGARLVALSDLHESGDAAAHGRNPRRISDEALRRLRHSIEADPDMLWARPVMATVDGEVLGGNMRLRAARLDPPFEAIPTYVLEGDPATQRARMLRDNAPYGEWIPDELAALVKAHEDDGADMALLGFSAGELGGLLALVSASDAAGGGLEGADPDAVPEPPEEPVTQPGDTWILGDHRLVCGNAEDPLAFDRVLRDADQYELVPGVEVRWITETVDCVWTDPPYGVDYDPEARESYFSPERLANPLGKIEGDKLEEEAFSTWLALTLGNAGRCLRPGGSVYMAHAGSVSEWAARGFREAGFYLSSQLLWIKTVLVFGRSDYHWQHEPIFYGWKSDAAHRWFGDRKQTTLIEVASDHYSAEGKAAGGYKHPNQKPYDLIRPMLENSTQAGEIVLDPFGGSGSTLIVCEQMGRKARLLELDPRYCDVIVRRWETFTGREAVLERTESK